MLDRDYLDLGNTSKRLKPAASNERRRSFIVQRGNEVTSAKAAGIKELSMMQDNACKDESSHVDFGILLDTSMCFDIGDAGLNRSALSR